MNTDEEIILMVGGAFDILNRFDWLIDAYIVDFFVEDLWNKVPKCWREIFELENLDILGDFVDFTTEFAPKNGKVWPLSLLSLRKCCQLYSGNHKPVSGTAEVEKILFPKNFTRENRKWLSFSEELINGSGHNKWISPVLRSNVKPKKQHEISRVQDIVNVLRRKLEFDLVVDVGSGLGHLSRLLSSVAGLNVVTVEGNQNLVERAKELDSKFQSKQKKMKNSENSNFSESKLPDHNAKLMEFGENSAESGLNSLLAGKSDEKFCLLGLHTCGDLAVALLREFSVNKSARALVSLGCCYMKLNGGLDKQGRQFYESVPPSNSENFFGYPLSSFLKSHPRHTLSYTAREVGCHALSQYAKRLRSRDWEILKTHCYRAVLEWIIVRKYPEKRKEGLRSVKSAHKLNFEDYCAKALAKRNDLDQLLETLADFDVKIFVEKALKEWKNVVVFYSLRLILAPLVETVILYDRVLYLREKGLQCRLVPVFDPDVSPRNLALVGFRE